MVAIALIVGGCSSPSTEPARPTVGASDPNPQFDCRVDQGTSTPQLQQVTKGIHDYLASRQKPPTIIPNSTPPVSTVNLSAISFATVSPQGTTIVNCGVIATDTGNGHLTTGLPKPYRNVTSTDTYELGSETKVFTALALALLVGSGSVNLTDGLPSAFTNVPTTCPSQNSAWTPITLQELATHNSGLKDVPKNATFGPDRPQGRAEYNRADLYDSFNVLGPNNCDAFLFPPGTDYSYSNWAFATLGQVLADKSANGQYGAMVKDLITTPLGMTSTALEVPSNGTGNPPAYPVVVVPTCSPVTVAASHSGECFWDNDNAFAGGGGLISTVKDMANLVAAQLNILPNLSSAMQTAIALTHQPQGFGQPCKPAAPPNTCTQGRQGLAWEIQPAGSVNPTSPLTLQKNGGTNGSASITFLQPDMCWGITFLTNSSTADAVDYGTPASFTKNVVNTLQPSSSMCSN